MQIWTQHDERKYLKTICDSEPDAIVCDQCTREVEVAINLGSEHEPRRICEDCLDEALRMLDALPELD